MTFPKINEWFELNIENPKNQLELVKSAGYSNWQDWKYLGPSFEPRITKVKLIELGEISNLEEARVKAKNLNYRLLEGQAIESFKQKFPEHNNRTIVFGGNEWQDDVRYLRVAYLNCWDRGGTWSPFFYFSGRGFRELCLWLVVEQDALSFEPKTLESFDPLALEIIYKGIKYKLSKE